MTLYGKGPCYGLGRTIKPLAIKTSLKNTNGRSIAWHLYNWAEQNLSSTIKFILPTIDDRIKPINKLNRRYSKALQITKTTQYHCFIPISNT